MAGETWMVGRHPAQRLEQLVDLLMLIFDVPNASLARSTPGSDDSLYRVQE
jgi:hypothetical protein